MHLLTISHCVSLGTLGGRHQSGIRCAWNILLETCEMDKWEGMEEVGRSFRLWSSYDSFRREERRILHCSLTKILAKPRGSTWVKVTHQKGPFCVQPLAGSSLWAVWLQHTRVGRFLNAAAQVTSKSHYLQQQICVCVFMAATAQHLLHTDLLLYTYLERSFSVVPMGLSSWGET